MNRNTRHIVVLALAVATAAIASFGVYRVIERMPVREVEVASRFVAVAARALPQGVRLTERDVRLIAWPANSPLDGSHDNVKAVANRALLAAVVENEPLVDSKLARPEAGAGLSPTIPPGMRAMSVKANDVIGVAGFVGPGTRVDLVVTIRKQNESTSRTVVSNVQVLVAGTRADQEKARSALSSGAATTTGVVTLLVSPADAERIALAQVEGQIMLVMRNPLDTEPTTTTGVRSAALFGEAPPAEAVAAPRPRKTPPVAVVAAAAPVQKAYIVEAIRAAKRTEEEVAR